MNKLRVKTCHDRKGIEICSDNDISTLSLSDTKKLIASLQESLKLAESREPPAPAPLDFSDLFPSDKEAKEWCSTSDCVEGFDCSFDFGNWDFSVEAARRLYAWLGKALAYHDKANRGKHE